MSGMKTDKKYLLKKLKRDMPVLDLPASKTIASCANARYSIKKLVIRRALIKQLENFASIKNMSIFSLFLGSYYVLLNYICKENDIMIGILKEGCSEGGFSISRQTIDNKKTLLNLLSKVNNEIFDIINNSNGDKTKTIEDSDCDNSLDYSSIVRTAFVDNFKKEEIAKGENICINYKEKFDIKMKIEKEKNGETFLSCEYNSNFFNPDFIGRFLEYYKKLLTDLGENENKKIAEIEIVFENEKNFLINKCNNTYYAYPKNKTIQELFEGQAQKVPNKTAVMFNDELLTYKELNDKANNLALFLRIEGVRKNNIVSILLERNLNLIVGILAVLKAGGTCLLLNSDYPAKKIERIVKDCGSKTLITEKEVNFGSKKIKIVDISNDVKIKKRNLKNINDVKDSAFLVSTSGSSGKSKYVILSHQGIINNLFHRSKIANINSESITCLSSLMEFVAMPHHVLLPLVFGAKLIVYSKEIIKDPSLLFENMDNDKVSAVEVSVNSLLRYIDIIKQNGKKFSLIDLNILWLSGAKMDKDALNFFMKKYKKLNCIIVYGCSEYSMVLNNKVSQFVERITEGRPSLNTQLHILNKNKKIMPCGIFGDIYVSGEGMSKGYLNNYKKNKEVFLPHFLDKNKIMYKTGDLAKRHEDGSIEILGRADNQINLRGYRLEPGEIEVFIKKFKGIKEVVVVKYKENLAAFYSLNNKRSIKIKELEMYLKELLPQYMIPALFVRLKEVPINKNGKIDRLKIAKYNIQNFKINKYEKPIGLVEEELCRIWQNILNEKKVGRKDNFFNLGGHSLLAIDLLHKINLKFKIKINLEDIVNNLELYKMSHLIEEKILKNQIGE